MRLRRQQLANIFTDAPGPLCWDLRYIILEFAGLVFCGRRNSVFVINCPRLVQRSRRPRLQ